MVGARRAVALLSAAVLVCACHDVVEYGSAGSYGVRIIRASDMVQEDCIEGFEGGRAICSLGNNRFLVVSNRGTLYSVDSRERAVEEVYQIGTPFSTGYNDMTQASVGRVYIVGGFGKLIEFNATIGYVADEFGAGPSPRAICSSLTEDRIYVSDSYDQRLREVWTSDNTVYRELQLDATVGSMAPYGFPEGYLAAACEDDDLLYNIDLANFIEQGFDLVDECSGVAVLADTSIFCVTHPDWGHDSGRVTIGDRYGAVPTAISIAVEGHPTAVCARPYGSKFYVSSVLDDGTSRILAIDGLLWGIVQSSTIDGYAWDITTHANGEYLLVLTSS